VDELTRLAVAARDGDRIAVHAFVRATQADVWRVCASLNGREAADDLTQETFVRVLAALPRFRAESGARTWLWSIARHTALGARRSAWRQSRLAAAVAGAAATGRGPSTPSASGVTELDLLVRALPAERREAFVLTQWLGFSYAEAAEIAACEVGTIRSRVSRAREALVGQLEAAAEQ
jgi:RNA polymerase sigma-70 factor (ECF subfamily)